VAINNDPWERQYNGAPKTENGELVMGPTLTLLCDPESQYCEKIKDVVFLHKAPLDERSGRAVGETCDELKKRGIKVYLKEWEGEDPTDHLEIFRFLKKEMLELRQEFRGRELVIHISPGTPSMHTLWVLMAETGFIEKPFVVVKSYKKQNRKGRGAVVTVDLGIETFYKQYLSSRPLQTSSEEQAILWDPGRFQSEAMRRVYAEARRFAQLKVPVLIRGERGTGKTTLAGWIRSNSPFRREEQDQNWPGVACGQYSPQTMRTELFGYKKGAFTGAETDRKGLLAIADEDTLFLDEVGDISRDLQRLLIRAVEEKSYFPLGSEIPEKSDFRLLTATNIDEVELRERLDPDFLDRISMFTLTLPPLRDVPEELDWLWEVVYQEATRRAGVDSRSAKLGKEHHRRVVAGLKRHPLPGNLRDLFRVAYRILAARMDPLDSLNPEKATTYGLEAIGPSSSASQNLTSLSRSLAAAFAHGTTIDDLLPAGEVLQTKQLTQDMQAFLAQELFRIASERNVKADTLCDVGLRTLQDRKAKK
jgi:DNA-binding NtrC family response regulator